MGGARTILGGLAAATALALAGAAPAAAADPPPNVTFAVGSPGMLVAQQIARAYWGMDACGGQVSIAWTVLDPDINATSTWSNPTAAYGDGAENTDCSIAFNDSVPFDWPMFCTVVVHEYGHLTGHPHSPDPNDVMTPVYDKPLAQCAATPQPGVTPPPAPAPVPATTATTAAHVPPPDRLVVRRRPRVVVAHRAGALRDRRVVRRPARRHRGVKHHRARRHHHPRRQHRRHRPARHR